MCLLRNPDIMMNEYMKYLGNCYSINSSKQRGKLSNNIVTSMRSFTVVYECIITE